MFTSHRQRLRRLLDTGGPALLRGGLRGVEKECLRVSADGRISQTPHPKTLGAALTHPAITTDYSEALLEFITPPTPDLADTLRTLNEIHAFVYQHLNDEILWATSMPCVVGGDASIPIADYGRSNVGRFKHIYRQGLGLRYGRVMQAIAGVHFNYSLPIALWPVWRAADAVEGSDQDARSDGYFRLIRNFQRHGWLVPYLFGASPAVCKSFLGDRPHRFETFDRGTLYAPHATSLRMSDIGYKNKAQAGLRVSYDGLDRYVADLSRAIATPDPEYSALGTQVDGVWRQLSGNILQIEAEYYSFIRPKCPPRHCERPTLALSRRGVEYVEVRALDVNAFEPTGVDPAALRFIEALLLFCLLEDSPPVSESEQAEIAHNQAEVARRGRAPGLTLRRHGEEIPLREWAGAVCDALEPIAELLDDGATDRLYRAALEQQRRAVEDPERTPSARVLTEMRERQETFIAFAMRLSRAHAERFRHWPLADEANRRLESAAQASLAAQARMEANEKLPFEEYVQRYFASECGE